MTIWETMRQPISGNIKAARTILDWLHHPEQVIAEFVKRRSLSAIDFRAYRRRQRQIRCIAAEFCGTRS
jgi:hypothetical protein